MTDIRRVTHYLNRAGYSVVRGGKHIQVRRPNGTLLYTLSSTPSDGRRFLMNVRSDLRRLGVPVEGL